MPSTNLTSLYKWGASLCYQKVHGGSMPAAAGPGWERRRANYYVAAISGLPHFGFTASGSTVLDTPANRQTYYIRELVRHIGMPTQPNANRWVDDLYNAMGGAYSHDSAETLTASWITSIVDSGTGAGGDGTYDRLPNGIKDIIRAWVVHEGGTYARVVQSPAQQRILRAHERDPDDTHLWDEFTAKRSTAVSIEQQFLVKNIGWYSGYNQSTIDSKAYKNFLNITGDPQDALASFISRPNMGPLLRIKPYQRAVCVPKLRLYKVFHPFKDARARVVEKELPFHTFTDAGSITEARGSTGAGLIKATVDYEGTNFYSATRELKVQLGFYFQDLRELKAKEPLSAASRPPWERDPTYLDLVWRSPKMITSADAAAGGEDHTYNPDHFELKLVIGWSVPQGVSTDIIPQDLRKSIENMTEVVYLTQIDHTFSFNQDGSAELAIDYRGRVEEALESPRADILYDARLQRQREDIEDEVQQTRGQLDALAPGTSRTALEAKLKKLQKRRKSILLSDRKERYMNILNRLLKHDSVFYSDVLFTDMKDVRTTTRISVGSVPATAGTSVSQRHRANIVNATGGSADYNARLGEEDSGGTYAPNDELAKALWYKDTDYDRACKSFRFNYFFFGDLLDVVIEIMRSNHKEALVDRTRDEAMMDDIYYILTAFKYETGSEDETFIPLASIPVSLNFFTDWMVKNVLSDQKNTYFLMDFVKAFVKDALVKPFNSIEGRQNVKDKNYSMQFGYKVISLPPSTLGGDGPGTAPSAPAASRHSEGWKKNRRLTIPELKRRLGWTGAAHPKSVDAEMPLNAIHNAGKSIPQHCVIFYPYTFELKHGLSGNYAADLKDGLYHLGLGHNDGIVNEIKFAKSEVAYQAEAEFLKDDRTLGQMKRIYNATVSTMGNTLFYPGSLVFLDPSIPGMLPPVGTSLLAKLGLGGYYVVTKVSLELTPQTFETTMTCIWRGRGGPTTRTGGAP